MYQVLIRVIVAASLLELGIHLSEFSDCPSRACLSRLEKATEQVLRIDWKPISVFPEEGGKF